MEPVDDNCVTAVVCAVDVLDVRDAVAEQSDAPLGPLGDDTPSIASDEAFVADLPRCACCRRGDQFVDGVEPRETCKIVRLLSPDQKRLCFPVAVEKGFG